MKPIIVSLDGLGLAMWWRPQVQRWRWWLVDRKPWRVAWQHTQTKGPTFLEMKKLNKKSKKRDLLKKTANSKKYNDAYDPKGLCLMFGSILLMGKLWSGKKWLACWRPGLNSKNPIPLDCKTIPDASSPYSFYILPVYVATSGLVFL